MLRRIVVPLLFFAFLLCGAGPPPEGTSVDFATGVGNYHACSGGLYRRYGHNMVEPMVYGAVHHRQPNGVTYSGQVTAGESIVASQRLLWQDDDEEREDLVAGAPDPHYYVGEAFPLLGLSLTGGWHKRWFGVEGGPGFVYAMDMVQPVLTLSAWGGDFQRVYGWERLYAGPMSGYFGHNVAGGVGLRWGRWRSEFGVAGVLSGVTGTMYLTLNPSWEVGVTGQVHPLEVIDNLWLYHSDWWPAMPAMRTTLSLRWHPGR